MKQICFFLLLATGVLHGQNYYAGTPVYDTLISSNSGGANYSATGCPSYVITFDNSLINDPAGTQVYLKITGGSMAVNSLHETNNGVLNINDSIMLSSSNCSFSFYSSNGTATFHFAFLRCGTPTLQGDSFMCTNDIQEALSYMVDGCMGYIERNFYPGALTDSCAVNGPLAAGSSYVNAEEIKLFPVPVSNKCSVLLPRAHGENLVIQIMNIDGRQVREQSFKEISGDLLELNTDGIASGIYMIRILDGDLVYNGRMIKE